jgi:hypothetical protein
MIPHFYDFRVDQLALELGYDHIFRGRAGQDGNPFALKAGEAVDLRSDVNEKLGAGNEGQQREIYACLSRQRPAGGAAFDVDVAGLPQRSGKEREPGEQGGRAKAKRLYKLWRFLALFFGAPRRTVALVNGGAINGNALRTTRVK